MDFLQNLSLGFSVAFSPINLLYCFFGALVGTLVGVLPGISPLNTVAMLLPFTFGMEPTSALIMLAGIFYGAQYGGSTSAILVNVPGETSAVVTCLDGHQLAKQGKAGTRRWASPPSVRSSPVRSPRCWWPPSARRFRSWRCALTRRNTFR